MKNKLKTVVIVGSPSCGKTSVFNSLYQMHYRHACFAQGTDYSLTLKVGGVDVAVTVFDTKGSEELFDIRRIVYLTADVVVLTFALDDRQSLHEVETKWYPELRYYAPTDVPIVLVGNKADLRQALGQDQDLVGHFEGLNTAKRIKAHSYVECSGETGVGVLGVFVNAVRASSKPKSTSRRCVVL